MIAALRAAVSIFGASACAGLSAKQAPAAPAAPITKKDNAGLFACRIKPVKGTIG